MNPKQLRDIKNIVKVKSTSELLLFVQREIGFIPKGVNEWGRFAKFLKGGK